jgi:hypothetical protein
MKDVVIYGFLGGEKLFPTVRTFNHKNNSTLKQSRANVIANKRCFFAFPKQPDKRLIHSGGS